jgi:hypothetical protein
MIHITTECSQVRQVQEHVHSDYHDIIEMITEDAGIQGGNCHTRNTEVE